MRQNILSAVFDERAQAQQAVSQLLSAGVGESAISIVGRPDDELASGDKSDEGDEIGDVAVSIVSRGVPCTVLGVPGLAIPAIMPLAAAGAIAASAVPTTAAVTAGVEGARGALAKMLTHHEVEPEDASYYEERVRSGSFFISIDMRRVEVSADTANEILGRFGGYNASRPRATTVSERG